MRNYIEKINVRKYPGNFRTMCRQAVPGGQIFLLNLAEESRHFVTEFTARAVALFPLDCPAD